MKYMKDKLLNYMLYSGVTKQEYEKIKQEIQEKNRSVLSLTALCLVVMFSGLLLGSLFLEMMKPNHSIYGIVGLSFILIAILSRRIENKSFVLPLWYLAMTIMCVYAIILNTVLSNNISATTFCVIMIVAPLLVIDRPWRLFGYFAFITLIFVLVDFSQKAYYLAFTDTVNALCCIFLGSVIHINIMNTKLREMLQRHYIEAERDTDKLTGCLTKAAFERKITKEMKDSQYQGVLLVMDLDHFKSINDNYGHVFGDMVLRTMGECLQKSFPETGLRGRFGGDEFQVWISGKVEKSELTLILNGFFSDIHAIKTPDGKVEVAVSVGGAMCPRDGMSYQVLFENADASLYAAKKLDRSGYVFCPENGTKKGA